MYVRTPVAAILMIMLATPALGLGVTPEAHVAIADDVVDAGFQPILHLADQYADQYPLEPAPEGLSVEESVDYWLNERVVHGQTPSGWLADTRARYDHQGSFALPHDADLVAEVLRLYALLDVPIDVGVQDALKAEGSNLAPELHAPFAGLVQVVADAYAEQHDRAAAILARWHADQDVHQEIVTPTQRDAMVDLQTRIHDALVAFEDATRGLFPDMPLGGSDEPLFEDPEGLIILGNTGNGAYGSNGGLIADPVLIVEPAGNDLYTGAAGGACPDWLELAHDCNRLALGILYDMAGDDTYDYDGVPFAVQGGGSFGGVGMLVDGAGDDTYVATFTRAFKGPLLNYIDGGAQGFAQAGSGLLLDVAGNDAYTINVKASAGRSIWGFGQGYGGVGSVGVAIDLAGDDDWLGYGLGGTNRNNHFQGLYPQGSGFYAGVGLIIDAGFGQDDYYTYLESRTTDYYAQGFGAFGGLGIQTDDGGDDTYTAIEVAHDPWIDPLLNCAFGTASIGGIGIFLEMGGDDTYFGDTVTPYAAATMNEGFGGIGAAYGLHVDVSGDDRHEMYATGGPGSFVAGRGFAFQNGNIIGNYLDSGGNDVYVGPGQNNAVWLGGADRDAVPGGAA